MTDSLYNGAMVNYNYLTCCIIGHRKFNVKEYKEKLISTFEWLITMKNVGIFLFGSKSEFNHECYQIIRELKRKYPHIKLIYVRAENRYLSNELEASLSFYYDETYYSYYAEDGGKYSYILRNEEMIDRSDYCVFYYNKGYLEERKGVIKTKSGTEMAYNYAKKLRKEVINVYQ